LAESSSISEKKLDGNRMCLLNFSACLESVFIDRFQEVLLFRLILLLVVSALALGWQPAFAEEEQKLNVLQSADAQDAADQLTLDRWKMIWNCEFDKASDLKKWRVESKWDNANNELQNYKPKACSIRDGFLYLEASKEDTTEGGVTRHYTSGKVDTNRKFSTLYGRFDCRFKVPKGQGYWPAFWMLPASGTWPPEIDWMEILGHRPQIIEVTNHYGVHSNGKHPWHGPKRYEIHPDFSEEFHTLSGIWNEREITCYIDGKRISHSQEGVPHEKMYLILNLAVGGDLPGPPDDSTPFPANFIVDYVRVYKPAK
jgi:beta-glucanase (GH16 family)